MLLPNCNGQVVDAPADVRAARPTLTGTQLRLTGTRCGPNDVLMLMVNR